MPGWPPSMCPLSGLPRVFVHMRMHHRFSAGFQHLRRRALVSRTVQKLFIPYLVPVFGVGGLGHLAVQYATIVGATVRAVDLFEEELDLAKELGANYTVNAL